jgi:hypothetical protein
VFINDRGKAKRVDFEPGYMSEDEIEAKSGVTGGMTVITEGNFKLNEGTAISVENESEKAQSPKPK